MFFHNILHLQGAEGSRRVHMNDINCGKLICFWKTKSNFIVILSFWYSFSTSTIIFLKKEASVNDVC